MGALVTARSFALLSGLVLLPSVVQAQGVLPPDPPDTAKVRLGPIAMQPRFELTQIGTDSNVFNDAEGPKEDFVVSIRPGMDARLRFGPVRLLYRSWTDAVYFRTYKEERSLNNFGQFRTELRFSRVVPYFTTTGISTQDRPTPEIDLRAEYAQRTLEGGVVFALLSRTGVSMSVRRDRTKFAPDQSVGGEDLATQLNADHTTLQGGMRVALTPFTLLSLTAAQESTRFSLTPERDSTSVRFGPQVEFDPEGILTGSASVGFRRFTPTSPDIPAYRGLIAQMSVAVTFPTTRVATRFTRDVSYSYSDVEPYYVLTGGGVTVTRGVGGPFDIQATASRDRMNYRSRLSATEIGGLAGAETVETVGGGVGYRLQSKARIGLNYELAVRDARSERRAYNRRRVFGSFIYGFQQ